MRTSTKEEREACFNFIRSNEYAVVSTSSRFGTPTAATITYITDNDANVYFFTRASSKKSINLKRNRKIALVIGTGPESVSAQISGKAYEVSNEKLGTLMAEFLEKRDGFYMTFLKLEGYDFIAYKVIPKEIHWLQIAPGERKEDIVNIKI